MKAEDLFQLLQEATALNMDTRIDAARMLKREFPEVKVLEEPLKLMTAAKSAKYLGKKIVKEYYYTNVRALCLSIVTGKKI